MQNTEIYRNIEAEEKINNQLVQSPIFGNPRQYKINDLMKRTDPVY